MRALIWGLVFLSALSANADEDRALAGAGAPVEREVLPGAPEPKAPPMGPTPRDLRRWVSAGLGNVGTAGYRPAPKILTDSQHVQRRGFRVEE